MKIINNIFLLSLIAITAQASQPVKFDHDLKITGIPKGHEELLIISSGGTGFRGNFFSKYLLPWWKVKKTAIVEFEYSDVQEKSILASNLGGKKDGTVLLHVINQSVTKFSKDTPIILICLSRGCASMIQTLDMLEKPNEYKKELYKINLLEDGLPNLVKLKKIKELLTLKKSKIFCANPLLNRKTAIKTVLTHKKEEEEENAGFLSSLYNILSFPSEILSSDFSVGISTSGAISGLDYIGDCNSNDKQPIDLLKNLKKYPFTFYLARNDELVGNTHDEELNNLAKKYNWPVHKKHTKHNDMSFMRKETIEYVRTLNDNEICWGVKPIILEEEEEEEIDIYELFSDYKKRKKNNEEECEGENTLKNTVV